MKLTLDRMCISTNDLCMQCANKLKNGEVTKYDVGIGKAIINASKQYKSLRNISLERVIITNKAAYLVVKVGDKERFEQAGYVFLNQLSDIVGTNIVFLEKTKKVKQFIEKLLSPVVPKSMTTVFIPPMGDKELKVVLPTSSKRKVAFTQEEVSEIIEPIYGERVHFVYQ